MRIIEYVRDPQSLDVVEERQTPKVNSRVYFNGNSKDFEGDLDLSTEG